MGLYSVKKGENKLNYKIFNTKSVKKKKKDEIEDIEQGNKVSQQQEENKKQSANSKKGYILDGAKRKLTFIKPPWNYYFPLEFVDFAPDSHILKIQLKKIKFYDIVITIGAIFGYFMAYFEVINNIE